MVSMIAYLGIFPALHEVGALMKTGEAEMHDRVGPRRKIAVTDIAQETADLETTQKSPYRQDHSLFQQHQSSRPNRRKMEDCCESLRGCWVLSKLSGRDFPQALDPDEPDPVPTLLCSG